MTVSSENFRWTYTGDASTTVFAYNNKIFTTAQLKVYLDGVLKTETTHYTVSGAGNENGGNVTFVTAPGSSVKVVILRNMQLVQGTDYPVGGSFPAAATEDALDELTMISQEQQEEIDRSLKQDVDRTYYEANSKRIISGSAAINGTDFTLLNDVNTLIAAATLSGANLNSVPIDVATIAGLRTVDSESLTGGAVRLVRAYSSDGDRGGGIFYLDASDTTSTDNNGTIIVDGDGGRWKRIFHGAVSVRWFGAKGDGSTDDTDAFTDCYDYCVASSTIFPMYIPASNKFYRLTNEITITERYFELFGDGPTKSVLYIDAASKSCLVINGAADHNIHNIGIAGKSGSYDGIYIKGQADRGHIHDIWIGQVDRYCIHHEDSNSERYTNVNCHINSGMRPAGLNDIAASLGSPNIGLYIAGAAARNHNATLVNCHFNGVGSTYSIQVGDGAGAIQTFSMFGGLIQAAGSNKEIYLSSVQYGGIKGVHIESNALISSAYSVDVDDCTNFSVENCIISGAVIFQGTSSQSGIRHCQTSGIRFSSTVDPTCYAEHCGINTGNGDGGPTGGHLYDFNGDVKLREINGNRNYGDNLGEQGKVWFATDFTDWVSTTMPCGFNETGGGTASQETVIRLGGTYSCQFDTTGSSDALYHVIHREGDFSGERIVIEAWIYNVATTGLTTMTAYYNGGATTLSVATRQADEWERVLITLDVPASTVAINIRFTTASAGTFHLGRFVVRVPNWFDHLHERTLDDSATPDLKGDEGWVPELVRSGGTTTITSFINPIVGREFTLLADHSVTVNDTATINLSGAANQALTVGSTLSFKYDGTLFTETGRMIV